MKTIPLMPILAAALITAAPAGHCETTFDLRPHWDDAVPLKNPHKGWYHHYPDNHINKYLIKSDADLLGFPGMDHLYLRLAWAYLEPREGQFNWAVIDDLIGKWTAHGLGIAFRISCRETSSDRIEQQFATPRWVVDAGAQGGFYYKGEAVGPTGPWEPDYGDPVFLEKLDRFLAAFAARYDGQPWVRYVDIGSIGDWGEGHTSSGSRKECGFAVRKTHVDLHLKHFKQSRLMISDDYIYALKDPEERRRLHRHVLDHGISYRDDSILVNGYLAGQSKTFTVRSPEFFADAYPDRPTVFELEHYGKVKGLGNWDARPDSLLAKHGGGLKGPDFFRGALGLLHATYIGYHGDAREWLADNPALTVELLNRCGYWYFLHRVELPDSLRAGSSNPATLVWENRGVAPAYHAYQLKLRLAGPETIDLSLDSQNRRWLPVPQGATHTAHYVLDIPKTARPGRYTLKLKLHSPEARRDIFLALNPKLLDGDNFYRLGVINIAE